MKKKTVSIAHLTLLTLGSAFAQGYEIKLKVPSLKDSSVVLYHRIAKENNYYADDTIRLDKTGSGTFKGKNPLSGGLYSVLLGKKHSFIFIVGSNQKFSMETDTADAQKNVKFKGSTENTTYNDYLIFLSDRVEKQRLGFEKFKMAKTQTQKDSVTKFLSNMNTEVRTYFAKVIEQNPYTFLATYVKANIEPEVPPTPKDSNGKAIDSLFSYHYLKAHYFDNFDIADIRLLRTPLYENKVINYLDNMVFPNPDSINEEVDKIIEKVRDNDELFKFMLINLYSHYLNSKYMQMENVTIHIADKYYIPYATWSDKKYIETLKKYVDHSKPNLIGKIAPNIQLQIVPADHFVAAQSDTALKSNPYVGTVMAIQNIPAKYLVVVFWDADCGHCKKAMPLLYDSVYTRIQPLGAKVIAIETKPSIPGKRRWIDFVNEHSMYNWINAWSPYSVDYMDLYNAYTTPMIYILDESKRIIARRISVEQIENIIKSEMRNLK